MEETAGYSFAEMEELKNLLILRYIDAAGTGTGRWSNSSKPRPGLGVETPRRLRHPRTDEERELNRIASRGVRRVGRTAMAANAAVAGGPRGGVSRRPSRGPPATIASRLAAVRPAVVTFHAQTGDSVFGLKGRL